MIAPSIEKFRLIANQENNAGYVFWFAIEEPKGLCPDFISLDDYKPLILTAGSITKIMVMRQREVWNALSVPWTKYRKRAWPETKDFLKKRSGLVLDAGCGSGRNLEKSRAHFVGVDFAEKQLVKAKKGLAERKIPVSLACGNATQLPFGDSTFDAAICVSVLQCVEGKRNREKAAAELSRVLKKGAEALVTAWNREQPRFDGRKEDFVPWNFKGRKYMRYYYLFDEKELKNLLERNGLEILDMHGSEAKAFNMFPRNIIATARKL